MQQNNEAVRLKVQHLPSDYPKVWPESFLTEEASVEVRAEMIANQEAKWGEQRQADHD